MKRPKVSVIIPVYNASRYMRRTVDNLVSQTFDEMEIIFVENESNDDSAALAGRAANKYSQIRFYKQKKEGVSAARNLGIEKARGEFVCFMDDDDIQTDDIVSKLYNAMQDVDMSVCGFKIWDGKNLIFETKEAEENVTHGRDRVKNVFSEDLNYRYVWNKMFRRSVLIDNDIRFNENVHYNEDRLFVMEFLMKCKDIREISDKCYDFQNYDSQAMQLAKEDGKPSYRSLTSVEALFEMWKISLEIEDETFTKSIENEIIHEELRLIKDMLDDNASHYYKLCPFRDVVKKSLKFDFEPKDKEEAFLYKKLKTYAFLGVTKGSIDKK